MFVVSTVYVIVMIFKAPTKLVPSTTDVRTKSDYVLMLMQCILGILAMALPSLLERRVKLIIPSRMIIVYALFLYGAIYLGEIRNFYYIIPHWDTILHTFSGGMLGTLGFSIIVLLNRTDKVPIDLSPMFIVVFTFCFAVTLGVIWEIYEFSVDSLLGLNMQKFALENGTPLIGHAALLDTMKDLIVDCIGALVTSTAGYISLKHKKGWVERLLLKIGIDNT